MRKLGLSINWRVGYLSTDMNRTKRLEWLGILILAAFVGSLASGAIHECGHAVAAASLGAKIEEIHLFWVFGPPHVNYTGTLSPCGLALISIAGMLTAVLSGIICLCMIPFARLQAAWALVLALPLGMLMAQSLAWLLLPLLVMLGAKPRDDVIGFMYSSGCPPIATAGIGLVLVTSSAALFLRRTQCLARIREFKHQQKGQASEIS
jgi:hypothetical protein